MRTVATNPRLPTVLVALSGGVDSSVAARLLQEQGYPLVGATLMLEPGGPEGDPAEDSSCGGSDAIQSARQVADQLKIPHVVIDGRKEFRDLVLKPSWDAYAAGTTPSPCVLCNQRIKFGLLAKKAADMGAALVATGHYARVRRDGAGIPRIARGMDPAKDQAYFLFALTPEQVAMTLMPLGEMTKVEVRKTAERLGLSTARRKDSQDACFALDGEGFSDSLRLMFGGKPATGPVLDREGNVLLKRHQGLHRFTIGQRRGFGFGVGRKVFVKELRASDGAVILTDREEDLLSREALVRCENAGSLPDSFRCQVQVRSRHRAADATVQMVRRGESPLAKVTFDEAQRAVTPGQAAAFFDGDLVVGGGWILKGEG